MTQKASSPAKTTPTYSSDLSKLHTTHPTNQVVHSLAEARDAASQWDVLCSSSPLRHRVKLETDEEWVAFLSDCNEGKASGETNINLTMLLKKCYGLAFSMPPSPIAVARRPPVGGSLEPLSV
mmetsp:Transcript_9390/g.13778  ORF Transcript_9390/g.13778 Transcript_9390/m.13778 type:complete len:123 (+) Transcript_9390:59-427(+)